MPFFSLLPQNPRPSVPLPSLLPTPDSWPFSPPQNPLTPPCSHQHPCSLAAAGPKLCMKAASSNPGATVLEKTRKYRKDSFAYSLSVNNFSLSWGLACAFSSCFSFFLFLFPTSASHVPVSSPPSGNGVSLLCGVKRGHQIQACLVTSSL